jgi:hypothetical protein
LAVACICKGQSANGQIFLGASPEALGGAGRAANTALDAHFLNPAALALARGTNFGGAYQWGDPSLGTPSANTAYVITDNDQESIINGGVAYVTKSQSTPNNIQTDQDVSMDVAFHILPTLAVGVQGHRLFRQNTNAPGFTKYNLTAGALVTPTNWFGLAFVGYDLFNDPDIVLNPTFAVGLNFIILDIFRIRADASRPEELNPQHTGELNLGIEFSLGFDCYLRTGGEWNDVAKQTYYTAGFGFEGPKLNIAYAFRTNVNVNGDTYQTLETWLTF